jgi:2-dehydro-3-deoxygluconokinase
MKAGKVETDNRRFDLVSLGECLVELRRHGPGEYTQSYAGDVFNSLYFASRLGFRTGFISQFGADSFTDGILALCKQEGIDTSACKTHDVRTNGIYMIRTDMAGQPSFSFWRRNSAATMTLIEHTPSELATYILTSRNFLFSAIGLAVFREIDKLFELLELLKGKVRIHFDMNVRPALWDTTDDLKEYVERLASVVDVIFVSSSDDQFVYGTRSAQDAVTWYRDRGYRTVIYRDGARPTVGWSEATGIVEVPTVPGVNVVDATGAGDAFNAGFIKSAGRSFEEAIRYGNACGALAVTERGALIQGFRTDAVAQFMESM